MSKFCSKCGQGVMDEAVVCPHCGCKIAALPANEPDEPNAGLCLLSFLISPVGAVLFCAYANSKPVSAKKYGMWALIGLAVAIGLSACSAMMY